jgi:hypothetical protein
VGLEEGLKDLVHFRLVAVIVICAYQVSFLKKVDNSIYEVFLPKIFNLLCIVHCHTPLNPSWANRCYLLSQFLCVEGLSMVLTPSLRIRQYFGDRGC